MKNGNHFYATIQVDIKDVGSLPYAFPFYSHQTNFLCQSSGTCLCCSLHTPECLNATERMNAPQMCLLILVPILLSP